LPSQAHIRLVRLQGFLFWHRIQILSYPLNTCPAFEAISYTWDGQAATSCVIINSRRLLITRNAQQILHDFTPACGERMIWIDSICINQGQDVDSLAEKKAQISRMAEIYRRVTRVRVWLSQPSVL
ncbi:heterokaryon incompatibility protein-domain-containing protein, partial [Fusarium tricinctum]